jgi:hypothetical protein
VTGPQTQSDLGHSLHEIVFLCLKNWLSKKTLKRFRQAERFRPEEVRVHFSSWNVFAPERWWFSVPKMKVSSVISCTA